MEISITPELEEYVADKIASGRFTSPSEVFEAALRLLEDQEHSSGERREAFDLELGHRLAGLDRGEYVDPAAARERLRQKSNQRSSIKA